MYVTRFMNAHLNDMARKNRFKVYLHGPQGIKSDGMRCTAISIPGRTISTNPHTVNQAGPPREFPTSVDYGGSIELTFMLDTHFEDHQKINLWNSYVYNDAWAFRYPEGPDGYWGTVWIAQLDKRGHEIYEIKLLEAWPSAFGELSYASDGAGDIQTFNCTFTYRSWTSAYKNTPTGVLGGLAKQTGRRIASKIESKIEQKVFEKIGAGGIKAKIDRKIDDVFDF